MLSAHMRGILLPLRAKVPLCGGVPAMPAGWSLLPTPPTVWRPPPPPPEPPTQTMFARGPVWRWASWCDGLYFIPLRRPVRIHMSRCCRCMLYSRARTLYTNRRGWTRYNWLLCQLMCGPMGMRRLLWLCNP